MELLRTYTAKGFASQNKTASHAPVTPLPCDAIVTGIQMEAFVVCQLLHIKRIKLENRCSYNHMRIYDHKIRFSPSLVMVL